MLVSAIAAIGQRGQIGRNGVLPWHCRDDMIDFRNRTEGCAMLAGSATMRSLPQSFFDSLPKTNRTLYEWRPAFGNSDDAIKHLRAMSIRHVWIIGGAYTYLHFYKHINHLTCINRVSYDNDPAEDNLHTFFPCATFGIECIASS